MMTIITDLNENIIDLDPVKPFFYPLQRENRLRIIFPEQQRGSSRIESACHEAWLELHRNPPSEWQAIFIVNLSKHYAGDINLLNGSLRERLEHIRNKFLSVIRKKGIRQPKRIFVISLDTLERSPDTFEPAEENIQRIWELDTCGYVTDESYISSPFFTESEINAVSHLWSDALSAELRNVNTDGGISGLYSTEHEKLLAEKIKTCSSAIKKDLLERISHKKEVLNQSSFSDEFCKMISNDFESLQQNFSDELDNWINTHIARFIPQDSIQNLLKQHISECFSATSSKYSEFICLRFPLKDWRDRELNLFEYRRSLIRLAYLLIFLSEQGERVFKSPASYISASNLKHSGFWVVENIEIDYEYLQDILRDYRHALINLKADITEQLKKPIYDRLLIVRNPCTCGGNEQMPKLEAVKSYPVIQTQREWVQWCEDVQYELDNYQDNAEDIIAECQKLLADPKTLEKEDYADIEQRKDEFYKTRQRLWDKLRENSVEEIGHNWRDAVRRTHEKILDLFSCMPNWRQILVPFFTGVIILLSPFIADIWLLKKEYLYDITVYLYQPAYMIFPVIILLVTTCIAFYIYQSYQSDLNRLLGSAFRTARRLGDTIEKNTEINLKYTILSCELCAAVRNQRNAEAVLKKENDRRKYMLCHETKLGKHIAFAESFSVSSQDAEIPYSLKQETVDRQRVINDEHQINYYQPAGNLPVYAPASFCRDETICHLKMEMTAVEQSFISKNLPAIKHITIISDPAYTHRI